MSDADSPLKRSIGLSGVIWFLSAILAVVAIGAAFAAGRYAMAIVGIVFVLGAAALAYRAERARKAADSHSASQPPT
ncbi:MAG: hypothetical protein ACE5PT_14000 [Gemmatimonadales bacterium]